MSPKNYRYLKLGSIFLLGVVYSLAFNLKQYWLIPVAALIYLAVLLPLKKKVKGVTTDERDLQLVGLAAYYTITTITVVVGLAIIALVVRNHAVTSQVYTLSYVTMVLLMLYSSIYYALVWIKNYQAGIKTPLWKIALLLIWFVSMLVIFSFVSWQALS